jgi:acetyltransferase-like isoleucine patch superfamily enzyme
VKTHPLDFLLAGLALAVVSGLSLLLVAFVVVPLSTRWLGDYHVIADAALLLLSFGLLCAVLAAGLQKVQPLRPGDYAMEDRIFTYWKLLTVLYEFGRGALLPFTTVFARPLVAKLFGARIGRNVALGGRIADPALVSVGDDAILGHNSVLTPHAINSGQIILREVRIGRGATVGVNVVVMAGVEIGEGAIVTSGAVVAPHTRIPSQELWGGMPARKIKDLSPSDYRA